jgi:hypothetical protein
MAQVLIELNEGGAFRRKFVDANDVALWAEAGWAVPPGVSTGGQASGYDAIVTDLISKPGSLTKNAIDARVTAVGDSTYAPEGGGRPVGKNELFVNVRDFGATPSTGTDYTTWVDVTSGFQAAINYAITNKIGKVYVPGGNYLVNGALTVTGPLRIEGSFMGRAKLTGMPADSAGTVISTTGGTAGTFVLTATPPGGGATSTWGLSVADITFYGYGTGSPVDRGAIKLDHVWSELAFDNVKVLGFQRQGILSDQSQDGTFKNVTILSCGSHTSGSYAALDLVNNTNALHFFGLHIENSPYLLHLGAAARHNQFIGCKFEQYYAPAATTWNPIYVDNTYENAFMGCHFVQDSANDVFFYADGTTQPHFIHASGSNSHTMITNGMFTVPDQTRAATTGLGARWLKVDGSAVVQVTSSRFSHAYAGAGNYPFILSDNCVFSDNQVYNWSDGGTRKLMQVGSYCSVSGNQLIARDPSASITAGELFHCAGQRNTFNNNVLIGTRLTILGGDPLQNVTETLRTGYSVSGATPDVGWVSAGASSLFLVTNASPTNMTGMTGLTGRTVTLLFGDSNTTLVHSSTFRLRNAANVTPAWGQMITMHNDGTQWFEVSRSFSVASDVASGSITSDKIADGTIVAADLSASAAIAKTQLASAVQTSLGKADTAVQSVPVTSTSPMVSGTYYAPTSSSLTTLLLPQGSLRGAYFVPARDCTLTEIGIEVTTAGSAGALLRLGIYAFASATDTAPALLVDAGTVDATATGYLPLTISQAVTAGTRLLLTVTTQGAPSTAPTIRAQNASPIASLGATTALTLSQNLPGGSQVASGVTGALPGTHTPSITTTVGRVLVKAS